jgi:[ribosomal protein S18]-alanine N-acetyltransferase
VDVHLAPTLVQADLRHLDAMMAVMHAAFDPLYGEAWSAVQLAGTLAMPGCWARLALAGTTPTGFTLCRSLGPEVELLLIAVDPAQRRLGVGTRLLEQTLADASARGATDLFLEVREDNAAARHLYTGAGFAEVGRRPDYYSGKDGSRRAAITLRLALHQ